MPAVRSVSTMLCPGERSAIVAQCTAKGAQITTGVPLVAIEKSLSDIVSSSSEIAFGVVHAGSDSGSPFSRLLASCVSQLAYAWLATAAVNIGQKGDWIIDLSPCPNSDDKQQIFSVKYRD